MTNPKSLIRREINELLKEGKFLYNYIVLSEGKLSPESAEKYRLKVEYKKMTTNQLSSRFQKWYSKSSQVVKQILPDRYAEYKKLYSLDKRDKKITNSTYTISDYLMNIKVQEVWGEQNVDEASACISKFEQQIGILETCDETLDSKLHDIESILQFELFEDELRTAKGILKKGSAKVAGAIAGITLEGHLKKVCQHHSLKLTKQNPTIFDFNEELKKANIIDVPTWRLIQRLGDIRNLSVHSKDRDPSVSEVEDLIIGCEKLLAELF